MQGLCTLLIIAETATLTDASAAVLVLGAAYDVDVARLQATKRFVVDALGAAETLVLLKGVHYDRRVYSAKEIRALRKIVKATLGPTVVEIKPGGELTAAYQMNASAVGRCVWDRPSSCLYRHSSARAQLVQRIEAWWGVLQEAHAALVRREVARGAPFVQVACIRADIEFTAPVRHVSTMEPRYVYASSDPPDGAFLFGRRESARTLLTTYARIHALAATGGCARLDHARFMYSWFLPCFTVKALYDQGVRVVADPRITGRIRLHTGGGTPGVHVLEANPAFFATTFLRSDVYNDTVHAPPDDGFNGTMKCHASNRRANGYCGPWRYAAHQRPG